jgi:hypothetical protein
VVIYNQILYSNTLEIKMTKIQALENEVEKLPPKEYSQFRKWFLERDWEKWDAQILDDSTSGKLTYLIDEALESVNKKTLTPL